MLGLYHAAGLSGMDAVGYEASINSIIDYENILILHVLTSEGYEHFILSFGYENGGFMIWDPSKGFLMMTKNELEQIWPGRKCLGLIPNNSFNTRAKIGTSKRRWLAEKIKPELNILAASTAIGILVSGLGLVMAIFTQKLIDSILPGADKKLLIITCVLVLVLLSSRIFMVAIRQYLLLIQGKIFNTRVVDDFFSSLLMLPKMFFDTRKTGDFVARMNDTLRVQKVIADLSGSYIIDILVVSISITMIFHYSALSGLISLICIPAFYLMVFRWNKIIISAQQGVMSGYAYTESNFIDSLKGITEIKGMNWQNDFSIRSRNIYSEFQDKIFSLGKIKIRLSLLTGLAGALYIILVIIESSLKVMKSDMTQGELMAIISLSSALLPSILNLALLGIPLNEARVALDRMFEFTLVERDESNKVISGNNLSIDRVSLENISFRFPGRSLLLDRVNLSVEKGKLVSLVGESGCGKSTITNIIMRFYAPESGKIILNNNIECHEVDLNYWRSRIAIIPQEIHIFNGTILQNLITDYSESNITRMISTISGLGLKGFIEGFPNGLMTLIGEEGINLSEGQRQVVAYIRALLNKPDILIIDEGTSNLDIRTEAMIMDIISRLKSEMGILMISHRINIVKKLSDFIYVLNNRTIESCGCHSELIKAENLYSRFWNNFY